MNDLPLPPGEGRGEGIPASPKRHRIKTVKARNLRVLQTKAEHVFWQHVRNRQLGYKFKRQQPVLSFIADFLCEELKMIIEIDGGQHADNAKDSARDTLLRQSGYTVLRFWNNDVLQNMDGVGQALTLTLSRRERELEQINGSQ